MLQIYNTLTKKIEEFKPMKAGHVNMFVCGPTVYDYIHIGNARTFVIFDVVAKYLRWRGYSVHYVQNITDIDDKIIDRAREVGEDPLKFAQRWEKEFHTDMKALHVTAPNRYVPATEHIPAIIRQIEDLIANGCAYEISDGIYFDLSKFPEYGKLSGRTALADDDAVSQIDENNEKRNRGDFCLWKRSKESEPSWPAPWFSGRPGWHIEDTAITEYYFGPQYDLHGGGRDLIFPHHEAEITQQESASGLKPFVRYWMHTGFLENRTAKMSKSLGNFKTTRESNKDYSSEVLRLYFLSAHYRSSLDFSEQTLTQAEAGVQRIGEFMDRLRSAEEHKPFSSTCDPEVTKAVTKIKNRLTEAMDDDFNTPQAIAAIFDLVHLGNQYIDTDKLDLECAGQILEILDFGHAVLGIIPMRRTPLSQDIRELVAQRQAARDAKDFEKSDQLRDELAKLGWSVDDTPWGPRIKKKAS